MIAGLKSSVPMLVRASPEIYVNEEWLSGDFSKCISDLLKIGFNVRGIFK